MDNDDDFKEQINQISTGSARFGNFINYYNFYPADNRIRLLPDYSMHVETKSGPLLCLDVGCNIGELTHALYEHLEKCMKIREADHHVLAVDLDKSLIDRANEANTNNRVTFSCLDVLSPNFKEECEQYLTQHNRLTFDIIYCFSITMWIHLNHGDEGLRQFIITLSRLTKLLVIEPQPWKCYGRAVRRMKRTNSKPFKEHATLKIRKDVESYIDNLVRECNFNRVLQTAPTSWGRQVNFYKNKVVL